jgi:CO/xanthine dehydrogenase Mo-binding subunit
MAKKAHTNRKKTKPPAAAAHNGAQASAKWVGQPIRRKEEERLVRGKGIFVDDQKLTGMLHIRFVRSTYAHAKITHVDVSKAAALPGVVCTLTGAEVKGMVNPFIEIGPDVGQKIADYPMAVEKVVYQGEPVAAVVAETRMIAEDAAELVGVEYEPLPPVMTAEDALKDESLPIRKWVQTVTGMDFLNSATWRNLSSKPLTPSTSAGCISIVFPARPWKTTP